MWRYLVGAAAALALAGAGVVLFSGHATPRALLPAAAIGAGGAAPDAAQALPDDVPAASAKTREERRFGRYDKDRDGKITRDEYLVARHKAFAKLDINGDGRLSFEEWSAKAIGKFAGADADKSGTLTATEFATTAVKRKAKAKCPPAQAQPAGKDDDQEG
ncbi:histidine kinase [uncultured Sphingomonas sp.]|uniref:histidine kinase n=1 Tax=uncultured Sphingomonas sp. TaxID=158754 RepID=UPI0035CAC935